MENMVPPRQQIHPTPVTELLLHPLHQMPGMGHLLLLRRMLDMDLPHLFLPLMLDMELHLPSPPQPPAHTLLNLL
jgi:hypothetical protein